MKKALTALLLVFTVLFSSISFSTTAAAYSNDFPLVNQVVTFEVGYEYMVFDNYGLGKGTRFTTVSDTTDTRFDLRTWFVVNRSNEAGYYTIRPLFTNYVFDISEYSYRKDAPVILWHINNQDNQKFRFTRQPNGKYVIQAKHSNQALTRIYDRGYNKFAPTIAQVPTNDSWSGNREWTISTIKW